MAGTEVVVIHAGLQLVCWAFLLPFSLYIVRSKLHKDWTLHHRNLNLAIVIGVLGAVLTIVIAHLTESSQSSHGHRRLGGGHGGESKKVNLPHKETGWTLVALMGCQFFLLGLLRPDESSSYKPHWRILHKGTGYVIALMSVYQIVSGFMYASVTTEIRILIVSIFLPIIVVLWVIAYYFYLRNIPSDRFISKVETETIEEGGAQELIVAAIDTKQVCHSPDEENDEKL